MQNNYDILIQKLDEFIRKYYKNQLIKGLLYSTGALLSFFLVFSLIEYFAWFPEQGRAILFFVYLLVAAFILFRWVFIPLGHLYRIGKIISHAQAATIIGKHFPNVQDRLLNVLQLKTLSSSSTTSRSLIEASIDQKIETLKPIPFKSAVDFKANKKYLKYALVPLSVVVLLLIASPTVIRDPAERLVRFNTYYEKELPYNFKVLNTDMDVIQQEDYVLEVGIEGEESPEVVFVETGGGRYRMVKDHPGLFHYRFRNVQQALAFRVSSEKVRSQEYRLRVLPKPIILSFDLLLDYPAYTGKQDETLENSGDVTVPEGTEVTWKFYTRDADAVKLRIGPNKKDLELAGGNVVSEHHKVMKRTDYSVTVFNEYMVNADSLSYKLLSIPDAYPQILTEEYRDSIFDQRLYFRGMIKDDYGFKRLAFHTQKLSSSGIELEEGITTDIPLQSAGNQEQFFHYMDINTLGLEPGEEVSYYFEVWDNDAVNGSKSSRTQKRIYRAPTREEIDEAYDKTTQRVEENMGDMLEETRSMMERIDQLRREMMQKENLNWQDRKKIKEILDQQKNLEKRFEDLMKENDEKLKKEEQYREIDEDLIRKQEELQKLMDELFDDEMKKMFEELNKMLEEVDQDKVNEMMEKMKMSSEEMEKELDRNLELFKQLEFEKKLEETINRMEELAKDQEELQKETEEGNKSDEELKKEQDELNEEFENLKEDLDELEKKNEALENSFNMENTDPEEQEISEEMKESSENLQQGKKNKASKSQQNASEKMKKLSEKLSDMQQQMQQESLGEDIEDLRMILENLVQVSFDQEQLMDEVKETKTQDPRYIEKMDEQKKIRDDIKMIEDSLYALSKRQVMIQSFVNKEIAEIDANLGKSIESLENRNKREAAGRQQYVMTSINDLALMLSESMQKMQEQMQNSMGSKSCQNPNQSGQGMKSMRQMQEQLNKQMQQMKDAMEKGEKPGNKSGQSWSEQLARMAAQQEALRRQMEDYRNELNKQGLGNDGELKKMIEEMEQTETDLVNKMLTRQTLRRQQEILTRMLRSEKAEQEREKDEKRESEEAKDVYLRNPEEFLEYKRVKSREIELLRTIPPALTPYYRNKVSEYFYNFGEEEK